MQISYQTRQRLKVGSFIACALVASLSVALQTADPELAELRKKNQEAVRNPHF